MIILRSEYNELCQLVDKNLHSTLRDGTTFKQSVDYRYNIRGWLTSMNDASLANTGTTNDDTGDLFGMNLGYNNDLGVGNTALYNGNISGITWSNSLGLSTVKQNAYVYTYDPMNRIQSSTFKEKAVSWTSPVNAGLAETGYQYDLNGNITALQRNDRRVSGWMDNLVYNYTGSGNRLRNVKDNGDVAAGFIDGNTSASSDDYFYDANGNMVTDKNKLLTAANAIQYNHLNLPSIVTKNTGEYIKYTYDATGRKLKQEVYNASNAVTKTTDYLGEYIYENNILQFVNHEEGRIVTTGASPEYQYHLKDHLGNVRLTFTSKVEAIPETGTLEDANATTEQGQFLRYANAKRVKATILDKTNGASIGYAERLNGGANEIYGLAKSLSVMPGDVINIEVYAKYIDPNSANWTGTLSTLMSQIAANTTGVVFDGGSYSSSTTSFNASYPGLIGTKTDNGAPKAYLNWLIFDRNYVSLTGGFKQITTAGKEAGTDVAHELVNSPAINITTAGYVYIWLSNENATPVEVYFDDFKVTQTKSPVVATNDYYAFGLVFNSYSRENSTPNDYKFNGKEEQKELGLGWFDFGRRMYQPELGRFFGQDRFADKYYSYTPYQFAGLNPVTLIDVNGDSLWINFGSNRVLYNNGQLQNADGSRYEGEGVKVTKKGNIRITDSFLRSAVNTLSTLGGTEEGQSLIGDLQSSKFNFDIKAGNTSRFDPTNHNNASAISLMNGDHGLQRTDQPFNGIGSGGTIYFNPAAAFQVNTTSGLQTLPIHVVLGHEMRHASDASTGQLDKGIRDPGTGSPFLGSEIRGNYTSNMILRQSGYRYYQSTIAGSTIPILKNGNPVNVPKPELKPELYNFLYHQQ